MGEQSISFEGREVSDPKATLASFGIGDEAVLLLRKKVTVAGRYVGIWRLKMSKEPLLTQCSRLRTTELDPEMMRLQFLGNPQLMQELRNASRDYPSIKMSGS